MAVTWHLRLRGQGVGLGDEPTSFEYTTTGSVYGAEGITINGDTQDLSAGTKPSGATIALWLQPADGAVGLGFGAGGTAGTTAFPTSPTRGFFYGVSTAQSAAAVAADAATDAVQLVWL